MRRLPQIIFLLLLTSQLLFFLVIIVRPFFLTQEGHIYTVIDKNFFYPNLIRQGEDGSWRMIDSHTTLFTPKIFTYTFFILLGKVAAITHIEPVWMYLLARVLCGVFMFFTTYWFVTHLLPKRFQVLSLLFVLGVEAGPLLLNWPELKPLFEGRMMIIRNFSLPHHIFAKATGMMFIAFLFLAAKNSTKPRIIGVLISGLLSTIAMPAYTFTFALTAFPTWFIWTVWKKTTVKLIPLFLLACATILVPNIIFAIEFTKGPPWTNSTPNEKTWFTTEYIRMEYISSLLLYIPLILVLIFILPFIWKKIEDSLRLLILLLFSWIIGPFFWVVAAKTSWFPMPNHRLTDNYGFLPAGILAAIAAYYIITSVSKKWWHILMCCVVVGSIMLPSLFLTTVYSKQLFAAQETMAIDMYPSKELWEGIQFMNTIPKNSGVLVREKFGEVIPAFANVRVYVGGIHNFPDWLERQWFAYKFFSGEMTNEEVGPFLKNSNISYVFFGPDEQSINTRSPLYPTHLKAIFSNKTVTVFQVLP